MANPVLEAFRAQREEQVSTIDSILQQIEGRDLTDAERGVLEAARNRITQLDEQIRPLAEFEALRDAHGDTVRSLPRPADSVAPRVAGMQERVPQYRSAGAFLVDYLRANGIMERGVIDTAAQARVAAVQQRAVDNQTTADTPGILPQPIVGGVVSLVDANRPLITSLGGARALGGIPGITFTRPKITQHTQVGKQTAEKTQLPSRRMTINGIPFTKETHGGVVDISRQDIDWSSPAAWDILIRDLADMYAIESETTVATDFAAKATGTAPPALPAAPVLADWTHALYVAAMHSYQAGQRMPAAIWMFGPRWGRWSTPHAWCSRRTPPTR
jgi:HK97 family phage major capsid protein